MGLGLLYLGWLKIKETDNLSTVNHVLPVTVWNLFQKICMTKLVGIIILIRIRQGVNKQVYHNVIVIANDSFLMGLVIARS